MGKQDSLINNCYEDFYAKRDTINVYPTEFVVRTFLASYPELNFKKPTVGEKIIDIGFGDGRNTGFLCDRGLDVSGIEITEGIVSQAQDRLTQLGHKPDLRVGRNSSIPFDDNYFDYILSCHCCYYCDEGDVFADNIGEYARVLRKGGYLIASVADASSYIFKDSIQNDDGTYEINNDPYGNRVGYRLQGFSNSDEIMAAFSEQFTNFSIGHANNDYYGINERVFWVVCQKK